MTGLEYPALLLIIVGIWLFMLVNIFWSESIKDTEEACKYLKRRLENVSSS